LIRVLVADDHAVVRRGLRLFLDLQEDISVVGEAADGVEAVALAERYRPDVVLMDVVMPRLDGIAATEGVRAACPEAKVIVLSSFLEDAKLFPALKAGAAGYLLKDAEPEEVAAGIRQAFRGEPVLCADAARRALDRLAAAPQRPEGTVTIVFTDIEGSTRLLEELGEQPARTLFRAHDGLVRSAVAEHGGFEVEHEGDAFMLAFASARDAVRCAMAIQAAIAAGDWSPAERLRVRVGINTGEVIADEQGYFGRTVFVAARIARRAQGGQILLGELTRSLLGGEGPPCVERGATTLRGLSGSHRLFEAVWDETAPPADPAAGALTARELDVLRLVGRGLPNKLIARELALSEKTVKTHLTSIYAKLGVSDRTQAAVLAVREGLVEDQ
jgi:DNA-binding NarL/FixJ family response regulator